MAQSPLHPSVFINCPFDSEFQPFLRAILFTVCAMGCKPRSALEESDSSTIRLEKIYRLIKFCRFSIHDLSRTELSEHNGLPRFNMPLELGIFLGIKQVTPRRSRRKTCLIFVKDSRNLSFITDINGMDVQGHGDSPEKSIESIRNWLCNDAKMDGQPASVIAQLFKKFESEFPEIVKRIGYQPNEPQYGDVLKIIRDWLKEVRFLVSAKSGTSASVKVRLINPDKST